MMGSSGDLDDLKKHYQATLSKFAGGAGEHALADAYEIGRRAVSADVGLLQFAELHHNALRTLSDRGHPIAPDLAWQFYVEALSPYELSLRAFHENARLLGLGQELTQKNEEIERARTQLQTILDATTAIIYLRDRERRFLFVNTRFEELFDVQASRLLGSTGDRLLQPAVNEELSRGEERAFSVAAPVELEETLSLEGGDRTYLVLKVPLLDHADVPYAVCSVATDISERKRAAEALRVAKEATEQANRELRATQAQLVQAAKMASLGELVAGIAHEINNPLAFVSSHLATVQRSLSKVHAEVGTGFSDLVRKHWDKAQTRLSEMTLGLERIRTLVVKLRTFSRLDEGELRPANIQECIESTLTILQHRLKPQITVSVDIEEPSTLECYPALINQALLNLLTNSIDALAEQGGEICIRAAAEGTRYRIKVADDGPGIPKNLRERVLDPFFTTKPVGQGTGLGLSITYSIVAKHAGKLDIQSAEGSGTTVTLDLPLSGPRK